MADLSCVDGLDSRLHPGEMGHSTLGLYRGDHHDIREILPPLRERGRSPRDALRPHLAGGLRNPIIFKG